MILIGRVCTVRHETAREWAMKHALKLILLQKFARLLIICQHIVCHIGTSLGGNMWCHFLHLSRPLGLEAIQANRPLFHACLQQLDSCLSHVKPLTLGKFIKLFLSMVSPLLLNKQFLLSVTSKLDHCFSLLWTIIHSACQLCTRVADWNLSSDVRRDSQLRWSGIITINSKERQSSPPQLPYSYIKEGDP
jgi:hypothetical protein